MSLPNRNPKATSGSYTPRRNVQALQSIEARRAQALLDSHFPPRVVEAYIASLPASRQAVFTRVPVSIQQEYIRFEKHLTEAIMKSDEELKEKRLANAQKRMDGEEEDKVGVLELESRKRRLGEQRGQA
ncbi:hypothetical protein JCM8547_002685 [Rhodosporidiobolus lusitaniae]